MSKFERRQPQNMSFIIITDDKFHCYFYSSCYVVITQYHLLHYSYHQNILPPLLILLVHYLLSQYATAIVVD